MLQQNMLGGALVEVAGPLKDFAEKLGGEEGGDWFAAFKRFLRKENPWLDPTGTFVSDILEPVGLIILPDTAGKFIARDRFVVDTSPQAPVKISYLNKNFQEWFLDIVEGCVGGTTLRCQKLRISSLDESIVAELGGKCKAVVALSELYATMLQQGDGKAGLLHTDGGANVLYVFDINGLLRAVYVSWYGGGWYVFADPVGFPSRWSDGSHILSRNF